MGSHDQDPLRPHRDRYAPDGRRPAGARGRPRRRSAYGQPSGVFRWGLWTFGGGGAIEILEPMGDDGFLHRFLDERGPGIHHVTFRVPSLAEACARARAAGYDIVGLDDSDPSWKEAFLHPKQALASARPVALPEGAHPALGTVFTRGVA